MCEYRVVFGVFSAYGVHQVVINTCIVPIVDSVHEAGCVPRFIKFLCQVIVFVGSGFEWRGV